MIGKDAINILKGIQQENLEENDFLGKCAIDMAIEALQENESLAKTVIEASELLRKQRPHGEWIPVSERLPSYSERIVLATVVRRDKTWNNDPYHRLVTYSNGKWYPVPQSINLVPSHMATIEQSDGGQAEVIAWMPLPDAYREETMRNDRERS